MAGIVQYDIDPPNSDPNGIAEDQQPTAVTAFSLDGAQSDLGTAGQWDVGDSFSSGIAGALLAFESAGNWSGVTFTITGKDPEGNTQTEDIAGPNATTSNSAKYWSQVTSITADGTVATDIEVGASDVFVTKAFPLNHYSDEPAMTAVTGVTGTIQFDIEETFSNILADGTASAVWWTKVSNQSTDQTNALSSRATGCRMKVDSYTDTAELQFHISYNPYR